MLLGSVSVNWTPVAVFEPEARFRRQRVADDLSGAYRRDRSLCQRKIGRPRRSSRLDELKGAGSLHLERCAVEVVRSSTQLGVEEHEARVVVSDVRREGVLPNVTAAGRREGDAADRYVARRRKVRQALEAGGRTRGVIDADRELFRGAACLACGEEEPKRSGLKFLPPGQLIRLPGARKRRATSRIRLPL